MSNVVSESKFKLIWYSRRKGNPTPFNEAKSFSSYEKAEHYALYHPLHRKQAFNIQAYQAGNVEWKPYMAETVGRGKRKNRKKRGEKV